MSFIKTAFQRVCRHSTPTWTDIPRLPGQTFHTYLQASDTRSCDCAGHQHSDSPQRIQSDVPIISPLVAATSHVWNIGNQSTLLGTARHIWGEEESEGGVIPISKSVSHRHNGGSYSLS